MRRTLLLLPILLLAVSIGCVDSTVPIHPSRQGAVQQNGGNARSEPAAQQQVEVIIPDDAAVAITSNYYFVIDGSGSMSERPPRGSQFSNKMDGAKWAVGEAVKLVPDDANIGLFAFDGYGARERTPLGKDKPTFVQQVGALTANGGTPLTESMIYGVDALVAQRNKQLGFGEYRLIVVTDGVETGQPLRVALTYAEENDIPIYGIGLGVDSRHALRNGTIYSDASSIAELRDALAETVGEMATLDVSDLGL